MHCKRKNEGWVVGENCRITKLEKPTEADAEILVVWGGGWSWQAGSRHVFSVQWRGALGARMLQTCVSESDAAHLLVLLPPEGNGETQLTWSHLGLLGYPAATELHRCKQCALLPTPVMTFLIFWLNGFGVIGFKYAVQYAARSICGLNIMYQGCMLCNCASLSSTFCSKVTLFCFSLSAKHRRATNSSKISASSFGRCFVLETPTVQAKHKAGIWVLLSHICHCLSLCESAAHTAGTANQSSCFPFAGFPLSTAFHVPVVQLLPCSTAHLPLGSHNSGVQEAEEAEELYISHLLQSLRSLTLVISSPDFPFITFGLLLNGNPKYCQQGSEQWDKLT